MNIAVIGTSGSGKSDFAQALADSLTENDPTCGCQGRTVTVVDGYVERVQERAGVAVWPVAGYLTNLSVALERWAEESWARRVTDHTITCGTLVETAVYLSLHFVSLAAVMDEEQKREAEPRIDAVLRMFSVLYNDICQYDLAFYLPPRTGGEEARFVDQQIQAGLEGFKLLKVTPLKDPGTQLEEARKAISEVHPT